MTKQKRPKRRLLVCDGDWLVSRNLAVYRSYQVKDPSVTDARVISMTVSLTVSQVFRYAAELNATYLIMAFDGDRNHRYLAYPLYKSSRKTIIDDSGNELDDNQKKRYLTSLAAAGKFPPSSNDEKALAIKKVDSMLREYGVPVVIKRSHEADDVLSSAGHEYGASGIAEVIMCTPDKDSLGSLAPGVCQWYPDGNTFITVTEDTMAPRLTKYVGAKAAHWTPAQFRNFQVLCGDSTDSIPEIVSKATAIGLINQYPKLADYFNTKTGAEFFERHEADIMRNRMLTRMATDLFDGVDIEEFVPMLPDLNPELTKAQRKEWATNMPGSSKAQTSYHAYLETLRNQNSGGLFGEEHEAASTSTTLDDVNIFARPKGTIEVPRPKANKSVTDPDLNRPFSKREAREAARSWT